MKEFRNTKPVQLMLDSGFKVDPFQFTGSIDETLPTTAARVADGSLQQVPNGTAALVGGGPTLPAPVTGVELGYAEITANFGPTAGVANTIYPVTGLSIPVTVGKRPVIVEAFVPDMLSSVISADVGLQLWEDGSIIQATTAFSPATANRRLAGFVKVRRNPTPGNHTYDVRVKSNITGTITIEAGVGFPAFIRVQEV